MQIIDYRANEGQLWKTQKGKCVWLEAFLGAGAMMAVYKARYGPCDQADAGLPVVVKWEKEPGAAEAEYKALTTFNRKRAEYAKDLPLLPLVFDRGDREGRPFLVMEYADGKSVEEMLAPDRWLPEPMGLFLIWAMAAALLPLYEEGKTNPDLQFKNLRWLERVHLPEEVIVGRYACLPAKMVGLQEEVGAFLAWWKALPKADAQRGVCLRILDWNVLKDLNKARVRRNRTFLAWLGLRVLTGRDIEVEAVRTWEDWERWMRADEGSGWQGLSCGTKQLLADLVLGNRVGCGSENEGAIGYLREVHARVAYVLDMWAAGEEALKDEESKLEEALKAGEGGCVEWKLEVVRSLRAKRRGEKPRCEKAMQPELAGIKNFLQAGLFKPALGRIEKWLAEKEGVDLRLYLWRDLLAVWEDDRKRAKELKEFFRNCLEGLGFEGGECDKQWAKWVKEHGLEVSKALRALMAAWRAVMAKPTEEGLAELEATWNAVIEAVRARYGEEHTGVVKRAWERWLREQGWPGMEELRARWEETKKARKVAADLDRLLEAGEWMEAVERLIKEDVLEGLPRALQEALWTKVAEALERVDEGVSAAEVDARRRAVEAALGRPGLPRSAREQLQRIWRDLAKKSQEVAEMEAQRILEAWKNVENQLKELEKTFKTYQMRVAKLSGEVEDKEAALVRQLEVLKGQLGALQSKIAEQQAANVGLRAELEGKIQGLEKQLRELEEQIQRQLEASIREVKSQIEMLGRGIGALKGETEALKNELERKIEDQAQRTEAQIKELGDQIGHIDRQITNITAIVNKLQEYEKQKAARERQRQKRRRQLLVVAALVLLVTLALYLWHIGSGGATRTQGAQPPFAQPATTAATATWTSQPNPTTPSATPAPTATPTPSPTPMTPTPSPTPTTPTPEPKVLLLTQAPRPLNVSREKGGCIFLQDGSTPIPVVSTTSGEVTWSWFVLPRMEVELPTGCTISTPAPTPDAPWPDYAYVPQDAVALECEGLDEPTYLAVEVRPLADNTTWQRVQGEVKVQGDLMTLRWQPLLQLVPEADGAALALQTVTGEPLRLDPPHAYWVRLVLASQERDEVLGVLAWPSASDQGGKIAQIKLSPPPGLYVRVKLEGIPTTPTIAANPTATRFDLAEGLDTARQVTSEWLNAARPGVDYHVCCSLRDNQFNYVYVLVRRGETGWTLWLQFVNAQIHAALYESHAKEDPDIVVKACPNQ